jgi:hypothetical protein
MNTCCETRMSAAKVERLEWVTSRRTLSSTGSCSLDDAMAVLNEVLQRGGEAGRRRCVCVCDC